MGEEFMEKSQGLPMLTKIFDNFLYSKKMEAMKDNFENPNIRFFTENFHVAPSYKDLHYNREKCFGYCSFFHKRHPINKEMLILLYKVEGFLP